MKAGTWLAAAALAALGVACWTPVVEVQCETDQDCGSGWRCVGRVCVSPSAGGGAGGGSVGGGTGGSVGGGTGGSVGGGTGGGIGGGPGGGVGGGIGGGPGGGIGGGPGGGIGGGPGGGIGGGAGGGIGGGTGGGGTCAGCYDAAGRCMPGTTEVQCGLSGLPCTRCAQGELCQSGTCAPTGGCNGMTCFGCCLPSGQCLPPQNQSVLNCGQFGQACFSCAPGQQCRNGQCASQCDATTCPFGCCSNGQCQMPTSRACGLGGQQCVACANGTQCLNGQCVGCGPQTCMGCCLNGQCTTGQSSAACGFAGQVCATCAPGTVCQGGLCLPFFDGGFGGGFGGGTGGGFGGGTGGGGFTMNVEAGSACSSDAQCRPPQNALCVPASPQTGYPGGYCTATCSANTPCVTGLCVTEDVFGVALSSCKAFCFAPGQGQSTCRQGYVCAAGNTGLPPIVGWCRPRCENGGLAACPMGTTCNAMTGYCQ